MISQSLKLVRNNFDLLRLYLAGAVCLTHVYVLSGIEDLRWLAYAFSADVAVKSFFVISGFLIVMSYERSKSLGDYAGKRVRRIYPAYAAIVLVCAFGLFAASSLPASGYFSNAWLRYVAFNLGFMNFVQPSLPGVFEGNLHDAVNGSLWTLKVEAMFYVAVPVIVWCVRRLGPKVPLAVAYLLSITYQLALTRYADAHQSPAVAELARQLPGQLSYFVAGSFLFYHFDRFQRSPVWWSLGAVAVLLVNAAVFPLPFLYPLALAAVVVFVGTWRYLGNFGKHGDFSYGLYISHFPIIQLVLHFGLFRGHPWAYLAFVIASSLLAAFLMWNLVEKRFLRRSGHYRATTVADDSRSAAPTLE